MKKRIWFFLIPISLLLMGVLLSCGPAPDVANTPDIPDTSDTQPTGKIVLEWNKDLADLDLYVTLPSSQIAYWGATQFASGQFSKDDTDGYGPEYFDVTAPEVGNYEVKVNYSWSNGQTAPVTATIKIYRDGVWDSTSGTFTHVFNPTDANHDTTNSPPNAWVATSTLTFP